MEPVKRKDNENLHAIYVTMRQEHHELLRKMSANIVSILQSLFGTAAKLKIEIQEFVEERYIQGKVEN